MKKLVKKYPVHDLEPNYFIFKSVVGISSKNLSPDKKAKRERKCWTK
jgi:hypothetical protein